MPVTSKMSNNGAARAAEPTPEADRVTQLIARDMLAAVGEVMLTWGFLETSMLNALEGRGHQKIVASWLAAAKPSPDIAEAIKDAAGVRNHLAHGLCGIEAQPATCDEARVICRDPDNGRVALPLSRLRDVTRFLDELRREIDRQQRIEPNHRAPIDVPAEPGEGRR